MYNLITKVVGTLIVTTLKVVVATVISDTTSVNFIISSLPPDGMRMMAQ